MFLLEFFLFLLQSLNFSIKTFFFLDESLFATLQLVSAVFIFPLQLAPAFEDNFFRVQEFFTFDGLSLPGSFCADALRHLFGSTDFRFRNLLAVKKTEDQANAESYDRKSNLQSDAQRFIQTQTPPEKRRFQPRRSCDKQHAEPIGSACIL